MAEIEIKQGTFEWLAEREGKITSSKMSKIMTFDRTDKSILSKATKTYAYEIIANSIIGHNNFHNEATDWGNNAEGLARHFYGLKTGNKVSEVGFINSDIDGYGGSPDGIIRSDAGIVEFKCPFNSAIHIKYCLIKSKDDIPKEYYWQCQSNMYVSSAAWCDFVSFDPRIDSDLGLFIYRLYRNDEDIKNMIERIKLTLEFIEDIKSQLKLK